MLQLHRSQLHRPQLCHLLQLHHLLSVLLKDKFSHTSTILQMDGSVSFRVHLKYVLEAFTEVCVTLAGIKQPLRLCATANLEADMVNIFNIIIMDRVTVYSYIVAEPLYGLDFPSTRRFVAQHFNCSSTTGGLRSCRYDTAIDAQCNIGSHVAGVRCTESKSFVYTIDFYHASGYVLLTTYAGDGYRFYKGNLATD